MRKRAQGIRGKMLLLAVMPVLGIGALIAASAMPAQAGSVPRPATHVSTPQFIGHGAVNAPRTTAAPCNEPTYFCFWVNSGYGGNMGKFAGPNPNWGLFKDSECVYPAAAHDADGTWNDCASSGYNDGTSGDAVVVYQNTNMGGEDACLPDHSTAYSDFASYTYGDGSASLNDSISSNSWTPAGNCG